MAGGHWLIDDLVQDVIAHELRQVVRDNDD